jgi:hypothetical protein
MKLESFIRHYTACALWSSTDENDTPLDQIDAELSEQTKLTFHDDCKDFCEANAELLEQSGLSYEQAGHDFWLTRNGHGAGFWDRGLGKVGKDLSDAAKVYGSCDLYTGDDGQIYCQ